MSKEIEVIKINGRTWHKSKGDEGQDVYVAQFLEDEDSILGELVDETSYDILIDNDADFYLPPSLDDGDELTEERVAFKFRKNVFSEEEQRGAYEGLYGAASESNNRGMAAGPREESQGKRDWVSRFQQEILAHYEKGQPQPVDGSDPIENIKAKYKNDQQESRGIIWKRGEVESAFGQYKGFFPICMEKLASMSVDEAKDFAKKIRKDFISDTSYATSIWSGIAGFYGRYPRIPYGRPTAYTDHRRKEFDKCYPFARKLETHFRRLLPKRWGIQKQYADKMDKRFLIGEDTTFTTITVNTTSKDRNARMACHRDAGSLNAGFSNLTVVTKDGKGWKGGYLVTPEVRAAINCRPGDLLLIDNMRIIHGNTPIHAPESGEDDFLRMSLVFYFREDMQTLGSWEYEATRRQFVDDRRTDESHKHWRPFWNGVSSGMWDEQEWYDYLEAKMGKETVEEYHPDAFKEESSLDSFF